LRERAYMFEKPNATSTVGLEIDGPLLKAAELSFQKGKPALDRVFSLETTSDSNVNPFDTSDEGRQLLDVVQKNLTVTSLNSNEVLIRSMDIKLKKEKDIDSVLAFQAEPLLPYPAENAILDRVTVAQTPEGTALTLIAARKDHLKQHLENWNTLGIEPEVLTCTPAALAFFSKLVTTTEKSHFVLNLGEKQTTCILVKQGKLISAQSSPMGLSALVDILAKEPFPVELWKLTVANHPELYSLIDSWRRDITRLIYALTKQTREYEINELLITGEGAGFKDLGNALCQNLGKTILQPEIPATFSSLPADQLQRFAVPIGAALSALPGALDQINFRQDDLAYPYPWKRLTKPIATYFLLCLALALSFYILGNSYISHREDQARQEYVDLLATMNKPFQTVETEFAAKNPNKTDLDDGIRTPEALTQNDISERLQFLQKDLKDNPDTFPFSPNTPRVTDVLAWLSTHPNVVSQDKENPANFSKLLQIENFNYTMVKRPELKKKGEKYQVKVEIEFTASTPKLAREFHDALIAPNDIVDPKGEVKWSSNKGKYRASFFLKDKTIYPSSVKSAG